MASSYTEKEVQILHDEYTANPCLEVVDKLSVRLNRPRKSIIAKLVKEGIYVTRGYRTKTGESPITKLQLVRSLEDALDSKFPGLDKAPKTTLKILSENVVEMASLLEDTLEEVKHLSQLAESRKEMLKTSRNSDDPITVLHEGRLENLD